ncbi:unnamed protein product [Linum tenue]|uniref:Uncharacterized protein n=1 Tax=Linum tenue TaxID=586396 RepID=A0AAV0LN91_9ROSI|nr:unnamed protein product [Linum tenue]
MVEDSPTDWKMTLGVRIDRRRKAEAESSHRSGCSVTGRKKLATSKGRVKSGNSSLLTNPRTASLGREALLSRSGRGPHWSVGLDLTGPHKPSGPKAGRQTGLSWGRRDQEDMPRFWVRWFKQKLVRGPNDKGTGWVLGKARLSFHVDCFIGPILQGDNLKREGNGLKRRHDPMQIEETIDQASGLAPGKLFEGLDEMVLKDVFLNKSEFLSPLRCWMAMISKEALGSKLQGLNLSGYMGSLLHLLHELRKLDLSSNNIPSEIPYSLPIIVTHL